jgi:NAD(P)-dependent dehydrogenase (short-subunit alcohol dehydrogenase family)
VVVTGSASGIGAATVRECLGAGYSVLGVDLAPEPAELRGGGELDWIQGDVCDPETWRGAVERCAERDPAGAWALIACAADVSVQPFLRTPPEEWRRLFEINVIGVVLGMQALLPAMVERGSGAIAVTCSVNSLYVEDQVAAYSASKSALLSATRTAALEHAGDGIRINAVCPGSVETPLLHKHLDTLEDPDAVVRGLLRRTPTHRLTQPEEVAALLRFLIGEDARGMAGSAIVVDGGLTATYDFAGD